MHGGKCRERDDDGGEVMSELHTSLIRHGSPLPLCFPLTDILLLRTEDIIKITPSLNNRGEIPHFVCKS